jgi:hypothetical protein
MLGASYYPVVKFYPSGVDSAGAARSIDYQVAYEGKVDQNRIWILENGYIVVDTEDRRKCSEICNCLFLASSLLGNARHYPISERELDSVSFDSNASPMVQTRHGVVLSIRGVVHFVDNVRNQLWGDGYKYSVSVLALMVDLGSKMYSSEYRERILLFYDAWHAVDMSNWMAGMLLAWICFEMWVYEEMSLHLNALGISKDKQDKILDFPISRITLLLLAEMEAKRFSQDSNPLAITADDLKEGDRIRIVRNRVVHGGTKPSEKETTDCLSLANKSLWRYLRLSNISYTPILQQVKALSGGTPPRSRGQKVP